MAKKQKPHIQLYGMDNPSCPACEEQVNLSGTDVGVTGMEICYECPACGSKWKTMTVSVVAFVPEDRPFADAAVALAKIAKKNGLANGVWALISGSSKPHAFFPDGVVKVLDGETLTTVSEK